MMPALFTDELSIDTRVLVERHLAESFGRHHSVSFDGSLQRPQHLQRNRHSMPKLLRLSSEYSPRLSSFGLNPGHEVIDTNVRFLGVTRVDKHCEFRLHVDTGREQYVLQKRYSQFRDLWHQLLIDGRTASVAGENRQGECRNGACHQLAHQLATLKFPRRKLSFNLHRDDDVRIARERSAQLQHFVEVVLAVYHTAPKRQVRCCVNAQCRVLKAVRAFLNIKDTEYDMPDWKAASNGSTTSSDEVPILDTPPSTTSAPSPMHEPVDARKSPQTARTSAMCLDELYTIAEDTERLHV
ncbi:hypothetical protein BBJ29_002937 [Phytophthora kernoviae]|uniref:PX domain-containing protein n=1 Tax=Phytophthora kernoviae TaxID=325452 RepID=A0A3F2S448_9STRA|nr:hypothetical protein BBJ29_002937 [Phytophthora kernoviae]RLN69729.1 hypothetical protein BBP00_00000194 [Phytophthora kernoviae]